jgi:DNA-binding CsgD family transcriptional regulator
MNWPTRNADRPLATCRNVELEQLLRLVDPVPTQSRVLVVLGDAGMGKSILFEEAAERARSVGTRVLCTVGRDSESTLAFASLHELLRPVLAGPTRLSARLEAALGSAFEAGRPPDEAQRHLIGIATLTLLSDLSSDSPLLLVIDDAHWLDSSSLDVITFVGHRLDKEQVTLLIGGREHELPIGFDRTFPELRLEPLSGPNANQLLNDQDCPPQGRIRANILTQSAGNPAALVELTKAAAADSGVGVSWATEPLRLSERLTFGISTRLAKLPEATQAMLLCAAVAGGRDFSWAIAGGTLGKLEDILAPAEELDLVRVGRTDVHFSNPFVRSAIYYAAPFAKRAAAHRRVAETLRDVPDRRAWHLAAATLGPDEPTAALLEAASAQAEDRDGLLASVQTMERAAELSPDSSEQARRLLSAATLAVSTGQVDWVQDLANRVVVATSDPELLVAARRAVGWASVWGSQRKVALASLLSIVEKGLDRHLYESWDAFGSATTAAYHLGTPEARMSLQRTLDLLEQQDRTSLDCDQQDDVNILRLWANATIGSRENRSKLVSCLRANASRLDTVTRCAHAQLLASAAFILDESDLAVELLRGALDHPRDPRLRGATGVELTVLGLALRDVGRWDDALAVAGEAEDLGMGQSMDIVTALARATSGSIHALRGEVHEARQDIDHALATIESNESQSVVAVARHALGAAALAEGSFLMAFTQLRQLFTIDGEPLHNHLSYLGIADIAEAAVRAGRRSEGRELIQRVLQGLHGAPSSRVEQLIALANAIVADPAGAEAHFDKGMSDPAGSDWPFERARLHLAYGEWMRRRRRINEAKPILMDALETFERLHAEPWTQVTQSELRACGVMVDATPQALSELTPQQQQIVQCASEGLTNREIGAKLFLSPRTIASHLYRSYPKLGITARHQLRDLVDRTGE